MVSPALGLAQQCMRKGIDTVPKNGDFVILEDDAIGKYAVARWSPDAAQWVDEGGTPCGLDPTHWQPFNSGGYVPDASDELGAASAKAGQALVRAHRAALRHVRAPATERPPTRRLAAMRASFAASAARVRTKLQSWRMTLTTAQKRYRVAIIVAGLAAIGLAGLWSYRDEIADLRAWLFASAITDNDLMQARRALRNEQEKLSRLTELQADMSKAEQIRVELAAAGGEMEAEAASARTVNEEAVRAKEAAARASDEFGRALRSERDKVEKLAGELAASKREIEAQTASVRAANEEVAKTKAANAQTVDQLQRTLQDERGQGRIDRKACGEGWLSFASGRWPGFGAITMNRQMIQRGLMRAMTKFGVAVRTTAVLATLCFAPVLPATAQSMHSASKAVAPEKKDIPLISKETVVKSAVVRVMEVQGWSYVGP